MNLLLNRLQTEGVMQHLCIPLANHAQLTRADETLRDRAIFFMGDGVRPGPYWAVHAEDMAALEAAGYKLVRKPLTSASAEPPGDDVGE